MQENMTGLSGAGPAAAEVDCTMSMEKANVFAIALFPVVVVPILAHGAIWGLDSFRMESWDLLFFSILPTFVALVVAHELLHAFGFVVFGRVARREVHFGIDRKTLSPYAGSRAPMSARAYRGAVLLPGLVLGVVPVAVGLASGVGWLTGWGSFMLLAAGGDFAALWAMRSVPSEVQVIDHPARVGCRVVEPDSRPARVAERDE